MEYDKLDMLELIVAMILVAVTVAWSTAAFISIDTAVKFLVHH